MDCAGHEGEKTRGGGEEEERKREREEGRRGEEGRDRREVRCVNSRSQWPFPAKSILRLDSGQSLDYDDYVCYFYVAFQGISFISPGSLHGAVWFTRYIVIQHIAP